MLFTEALYCVVVALLWGCTNPLMKQGSAGVETVSTSSTSSTSTPNLFRRTISELLYLVSNWRYTVPFLINQSGSVLYYWALSSTTLSVAVPLTNSLTLVITVLVGKLLGEKSQGSLLYLGIILVFIGIGITNYS